MKVDLPQPAQAKPSDIYTLHLYSPDGRGGDNSEKTYVVNWSSFLPKAFKRYRVSVRFRTLNNLPLPGDQLNTESNGVLIYSSLPSSTCFSVADFRRRVYHGWADIAGGPSDAAADPLEGYYYYLGIQSFIDNTIQYPTEDLLTIYLLNPENLETSDAMDYHLWIQFEPVA